MTQQNLLFVPLFLLLATCGASKFKKSQVLDTPRILALIADKPEVNPGGAVNLSALLSYVDRGSNSLSYRIVSCTDPGIAVGASANCDNATDRSELLGSTAVSFSSAANTELFSNILSFTVPATFLNGYDSISRFNGVSYILEFYLESSAGHVVKAIKRIVVSDKAAAQLNTNPTLLDVFSNRGTLSSRPSSKSTMFPGIGGGSKESYSYITSSGGSATASELLTTSWFVNKGSFVYDKTESDTSNTFNPDTSHSSTLVIVVVLRDDRGGSAVKIKTF